MFEQLLAAHVACLRVATPVDQIPRIDAQLGELHAVAAKYSTLGVVLDNKELDHFMVILKIQFLNFQFCTRRNLCSLSLTLINFDSMVVCCLLSLVKSAS